MVANPEINAPKTGSVNARNARRLVGPLLFGTTCFIGLPMLSWGIAHLAGFFRQPAHLAFVVEMLVLQLALVTFMPGAITMGQAVGSKTVKRQRTALLLLQAITLAIVIAGPYSDRREVLVFKGADMFRYLGLFILPAGFLLMNWAVVALGRQFSVQVTIQDDHRLVVDGPYRHLRHPRYSGIILFCTGFSLVFRSFLALALVVALILVLLWRIQDEEGLMSREFGTAWDAYTKRSWRLIPFVY